MIIHLRASPVYRFIMTVTNDYVFMAVCVSYDLRHNEVDLKCKNLLNGIWPLSRISLILSV